jgi:DNA-binding CsgD family transcriptional regulator/1,2-phenylacetyl-CoA epoxidase PaaB subunit
MTMTMTVDPTSTMPERHEDRGPTAARPGTALRPRASAHGPPTRSARGWVVGRREQRAALAALIDGARAGMSGAIIVRGAKGSGKTHLLDCAIADATDCLVLRSSGVEIESGLAFATVQQLCGPLVDRVAELPLPQAEALGVALGLEPGPTADPLLVGLGLVSLLAAVASERPVVCVLDDAEWVDESSAQAIGVASRRLAGVGVVLLLASGGSASITAFTGLDEMRIHALSRAEAQSMLSLELPGRLDPDVRDRILAEARGNPLAIRQFGRATAVTALAGGFAIDAGAEVDAAIAAYVTGRLSPLPDDVTTALLLAAAEPLGDATSFQKALASAGLPADVQRAAEATDLVEIGDRVLFSHPLARHVVYRCASDGQRRDAHRVLAESVDGTARVDHVSWHRSQTCTGPREEVAEATERSSVAAGRAGGTAAAAAFLERAAELSEEPGARARRALDAARLHGRSGGFDDALRLIADIDHNHVGAATPAMAQLAAAEIAASTGRPDAALELLAAAERIAATEPELSVSTRLSALDVAACAGRLGTDGGVRHVAAVARSAIAPPGRNGAEQLLHAAAARWRSEDVADHDALARAIDACCADESTVHTFATRVAMELRDEKAWATLARRDVDHARRTGAAAQMPRALDLRACLHLSRGEVGLAESVADEAAHIARSIGAAEPALASILLAGWRCSNADPLEWIDAWSCRATSRGDGSALTLLDHCRSLVHVASGRYEQALHEAQRVFERDEPFVSAWAAPEVVEAAVRSGRPEEAAQAFECARSISHATGSSWARGIEQRCIALLVDDGSTDEHFRESIRHLERSGMRFDLARTHLLYGEWLRRNKRRLDARTPLRLALEVFDALGAVAFATRAVLELRASGGQARRRTPDTIVALTERESQVAELAGHGFSNPEIGKQLFISPRTVEYHLHKVFSKLGITSRSQLRAALPR